MIDMKNTGDDAPAAGGTCSTPIGPAHACSANCDHESCHAGWFARKARGDGLVYCCPFEGWVTPLEAFEHSRDAYSSYRDDD